MWTEFGRIRGYTVHMRIRNKILCCYPITGHKIFNRISRVPENAVEYNDIVTMRILIVLALIINNNNTLYYIQIDS